MPNRTSCITWTKEETDELFDLCERFDLRFSVIADRFSSSRTMEELKNRYYSVSRTILIGLYYKDWCQNPNFDNGCQGHSRNTEYFTAHTTGKTSTPQKDSRRKPDGISRVVYALTGDVAPLMPSIDANQLKKRHQPENEKCRDDGLKFPTCNEFVLNCPNITTLALKGFKLHDYKAHMLVKGLQKLKHIDLSTSYSFTGSFLKNLSVNGGGDNLEVMILRDCMHLKEIEVERFMEVVLAGEFKHLKHLDISNREGLTCEGDWYNRCYSASFIPIKEVLEQRPDFYLVAEFQ
ncbi:hypothetical protein Lser_V15G16737 [Lactuca serriola]